MPRNLPCKILHNLCRAAVGPVSSSEQLESHPISYAYSGTVNLASGSLSSEGTTSRPSRKAEVHALLMIIGWGLLLPLGTVFARFKELGGIWFQLHRACQVIFLSTLASYSIEMTYDSVAAILVVHLHLRLSHTKVQLLLSCLLSSRLQHLDWHRNRSYFVLTCGSHTRPQIYNQLQGKCHLSTI